MMKLALVSALVASAAAFSPASTQKQATALKASPYEKELGAQVPVRVILCLVQFTCETRVCTPYSYLSFDFCYSWDSLTPWES